ncbi:MAG: nucleotidyltransferase family protein [Planctomycetota bacterium]|jgi:NDP-sugar pyrophosphorylase family protein
MFEERIALILAGGKGTRLKSVVNDRPKPMAEVAGRPFLEWLLLSLKKQNVKRIIICSGYMGDIIESHFGDGRRLKMEIEYSREFAPLGTAGAVRNAIGNIHSDRFLVLNGDSFCNFDVAGLEKTHADSNANATIWVVEMEDCGRYGSVVVGEEGVVLDFREKSADKCSGLINAGVYLFSREFAETIPSDRAVSMETEVLPDLIGHRLFAVKGEGPFIDIGTPESYAGAESFFQAD